MIDLKNRIQTLINASGISAPWSEILSIVDGVNASALALNNPSWLNMFNVVLGEQLEVDLMELRARRYEEISSKKLEENAKIKLDKLRRNLKKMKVDGIILPRADEHQGEYLPSSAERLRWLTGFDGSAGFVVVLKNVAAVFTDGRYMLQIGWQVDQEHFEIHHIGKKSPSQWLEELMVKGDRIGFDPWLHTAESFSMFEEVVRNRNGALVSLDENPIDKLWKSRPPSPLAPIVSHELIYAGQTSVEKRKIVCQALKKKNEDALILSSPESIAWLLNVRGADVPRTPLALSFAILEQDEKVSLFIDHRKITSKIKTQLGNAVSIFSPNELGERIDVLVNQGKKIRVDPKSSPVWLEKRVNSAGGNVSYGEDPVTAPKSIKNAIELDGTRKAHIRDGMAFTKFLHWFHENASMEQLTEMSVANQLRNFRSEGLLFKDLSFDTISGSGPNGAIVHYRVNAETDRTIKKDELYLVDSGAQYLDGTTDITRTIAIGNPGDKARDRFTLVLKGHIALASIKFPVGTTGSQLDVLARAPLWSIGADFDHGTGHGVGSYLGVHEGPQRISKSPSDIALQIGMIISNEPGFYKESAYGIRLENLIVVQTEKIDGASREMLSFETITLAPFDSSMINANLLTSIELDWINVYHESVRKILTPLLPDDVANWLSKATAKIK